MRIPKAVQIYKEGLPLAFSGLKIGNDLSNRTSVVSASTSWTLWYDPVRGKNIRSSAADALLWAPSQQRQSLTVLANHTVTKVTFDKHLKATGVTFASSHTKGKGAIYSVRARKSVILAAGTLASAPILERSGVGKHSVLSAAKVKQLVDLPGVGANLNVGVCPCLRNDRTDDGVRINLDPGRQRSCQKSTTMTPPWLMG